MILNIFAKWKKLPLKGAGLLFYKKEAGIVYIALGKRSVNPNAGYWSFAGGKLEISDKDYFACAVREAREEFFNNDHRLFSVIPPERFHANKRIRFRLLQICWHAYFIDLSGLPISFCRQQLEIEAIDWFPLHLLPPKTQKIVRFECFVAKFKGWLA